MVATVDDLEAIAADDRANVAALSGWRRELFGAKALELKHGRLALSIENGKVIALEWQDAPQAEVVAGESRGETKRIRSQSRFVRSRRPSTMRTISTAATGPSSVSG